MAGQAFLDFVHGPPRPSGGARASCGPGRYFMLFSFWIFDNFRLKNKEKGCSVHIRPFRRARAGARLMRGKIQAPPDQGRGPYNFIIGGLNHHFIGSLLPNQGSCPKFLQLYIYGTEHEISMSFLRQHKCVKHLRNITSHIGYPS